MQKAHFKAIKYCQKSNQQFEKRTTLLSAIWQNKIFDREQDVQYWLIEKQGEE